MLLFECYITVSEQNIRCQEQKISSFLQRSSMHHSKVYRPTAYQNDSNTLSSNKMFCEFLQTIDTWAFLLHGRPIQSHWIWRCGHHSRGIYIHIKTAQSALQKALLNGLLPTLICLIECIGCGCGEGEDWSPTKIGRVLTLRGLWTVGEEHAPQREGGRCHVQVGEVCKEHSLAEITQTHLQGKDIDRLTAGHTISCVSFTTVETALHKAIHEPQWLYRAQTSPTPGDLENVLPKRAGYSL